MQMKNLLTCSFAQKRWKEETIQPFPVLWKFILEKASLFGSSWYQIYSSNVDIDTNSTQHMVPFLFFSWPIMYMNAIPTWKAFLPNSSWWYLLDWNSVYWHKLKQHIFPRLSWPIMDMNAAPSNCDRLPNEVWENESTSVVHIPIAPSYLISSSVIIAAVPIDIEAKGRDWNHTQSSRWHPFRSHHLLERSQYDMIGWFIVLHILAT